jgi:hypothetical protein
MSSISAYCKARLLDGSLQPDFASLHTGFPGTTGANEVSGGAYARQGIVFSASSGDRRTQDGAEIFNVPASSTVRWIGHWQDGNWLYATPAGKDADGLLYGFSHNDMKVLILGGQVRSLHKGQYTVDALKKGEERRGPEEEEDA